MGKICKIRVNLGLKLCGELFFAFFAALRENRIYRCQINSF
jgi:hypothetical protein